MQPTPEQLEKLRKELDVVNGNLKVVYIKCFRMLKFRKFEILKTRSSHKFCRIQIYLESSFVKFLRSVGLYV